ncbi:MAG: hypothetical protein ACMXX6_00220 [Candidatus Woesearchaeota archaeon]
MKSGSTITIETGVDKLVRYLKRKGQVSVSEVAKEIGVSTKVVEAWSTFLMEENIIGIDYKFTTPYIYLIDKKNDYLSTYKQQFKEKNHSEQSQEHVSYKWKTHLLEILDNKKEFFYREGSKRGLKNLDQLWNEYKAKVTNL